METKISVIIPVYNAECYLDECLQSVLDQTLDGVEIICINDGSTDGSLQILEKYKNKRNVIVINQENKGAAYSRNKGIENASGEFVCFLDADDYYPEKDILYSLYFNAKANGVVICGGSMSSLVDGNIVRNYFERNAGYVFDEDGEILYKNYQWDWGFTRFCYELDFLKNNKINFPEISYYEDPPFFVKAMINAKKFYALKKVTYCYRDTQKVRRLNQDNVCSMLQGMISIIQMACEHKLIELQLLIARRIDIFKVEIFNYIICGDQEIKELLYKLENSIDIYELVRIRAIPHVIPILDQIEDIQSKEQEFIEKLNSTKRVIIYGAGVIGKEVAAYLLSLKHIDIIGFAVSSLEKNPASIYGIPVKTITDYRTDKKEVLVLIATTLKFQEEIFENLQKEGFNNILRIQRDVISRISVKQIVSFMTS